MTNFTALQIQTAKEIVAIDHKYQDVPTLLHIAVCLQESGLDPNALGDNGQSHGIHQLNQQAHPDTAFVAINPWYDYGYPEVRPRWQSAYARLGGDGGWSEPSTRGTFLEVFAPLAQGSIAWGKGLGQTRYEQALELLELIS